MLSTLLAWFLLWVLYLWLDRRRLLRMFNPPKPMSQQQIFTAKPAPKLKTPSRPQFQNSKPISEINREKRRAKQVPPDLPKKPSEAVQSVEQFAGSAPNIPPAQPDPSPQTQQELEPVQLKSEVNLDALQREAARRAQEIRRVSPKTQNDLYRLVHGDAKMIERLVKHSRSRYPDQSEQWVWEKVIRDLERDRGYR